MRDGRDSSEDFTGVQGNFTSLGSGNLNSGKLRSGEEIITDTCIDIVLCGYFKKYIYVFEDRRILNRTFKSYTRKTQVYWN